MLGEKATYRYHIFLRSWGGGTWRDQAKSNLRRQENILREVGVAAVAGREVMPAPIGSNCLVRASRNHRMSRDLDFRVNPPMGDILSERLAQLPRSGVGVGYAGW